MARFGLLLTVAISCSTTGTAGEITVACWNIENLFDSQKDTRSDGEPVVSSEQLAIKMSKLAQVIKYLKADIVGLIEVENQGLLRKLTREYLASEGFEYFMLVDETDPRGIDVAIVSKLPFTAYSFEIPTHTRGILTCRFSVGGEPFYVLINHWKSRLGGGADIRSACANQIVKIVGEILPRYEGRAVPAIVTGDLNDEDTDESVLMLERNGLKNLLKEQPQSKRWTLPWYDAENKKVYYQGFDHIFVNEAMLDRRGVDVIAESAHVVRPRFMLRKRRINNMDYEWLDDSYGNHIGYSDHLPVSVKLRVPDPAPAERPAAAPSRVPSAPSEKS